jgi:hypothetical protein
MDEFIKNTFIEDMAEVNRVEGISEDYVWYQSKLLANKMSEWQLEFDKVVGVMEARHKEHLKIIGKLLDEIKELKKEKEWVGLSDAEIGEIFRAGWSNNMSFARALEARLKEKNND